jgi:hypothetical protein
MANLAIRFIGRRISADLGMGAFRPFRDPGLFPVIILGYNW